MAWVDESVDDGFCDDGVFEEFEPSFWVDLAGEDDGEFMVTFFEDVHEGAGFVVGVGADAEVIEDDDVMSVEVSDEDEVAACEFLAGDFFEQKVEGAKGDADLFLAEASADGLGEMGFAFSRFSHQDEIFFVVVEGAFGQFDEFGFWESAVVGEVPVFDVGVGSKLGLGGESLGEGVFAMEGFVFEQEPEHVEGV